MSFVPDLSADANPPARRMRSALRRGVAALPLALALAAATVNLSACKRPAAQEEQAAAPKVFSGRIAQFQTIDERPGTGAVAQSGQEVIVQYTGWFYDEKAANKRGSKFDSSYDHGKPFSFLLGAGRVIRGWDDGVAGMRVGGKRVLMVPPDMAYGRDGVGGVIPPDASLVFEVELLGVQAH
ncbi:FKBP-type peptidyl-prolyl cis-trans isomerase [Lysobacter capsici AZ78]|uniref:Peptidyl-prolyl cis-trans isomerase n=2 Tax=Lysobacter capsici TaxID=435897 RepID=A0A108U4U0_9GAMM|nr:FKBP-type peptidyl-prolyl cis-trans isomerase [Lysobacter capsici AZ78]